MRTGGFKDEKARWKPGNSLYPAPCVLVSCRAADGIANLITVAWCGNAASDPPMLTISLRPERHSYGIIRESGEFVVNVPSVDQAFAVDFCGVRSGAKVDKFAATGLTPIPASAVGAPLVAECPINIECAVTERLSLGSHDLFVARVVATSVSARVLDRNGEFRLERANLLCFAHGGYYSLGGNFGSFGWSVRKKAPPSAGPKAGRRKAGGQ